MATKDKLTVAFRNLRKDKYFARHKWMCCQGCGCAALPKDCENYVFYHAQDADVLAEKNQAHLAWGGDGALIKRRCEEAGLHVVWDCSNTTLETDMLYNKNWDKPEVKADPFSLESLIAWLEKMPADETYNYVNGRACLLCQYLTNSGLEGVEVGACATYSTDRWKTKRQLSDSFWSVSADLEHPRDPTWTFGAALSRARKALADGS